MHLSSRPNQRFPSVGSELTAQKHLYFAAKMFGPGGPGGRLGMNPGAPPEEPGRDNARIVEDQEFVALKEFGECKKAMIFKPACEAVQEEKPRSCTPIERPLSNLFFGQVIIELVKPHKAWSLAGFCLTPRNERGRDHWGAARPTAVLGFEKEWGAQQCC
jgi:hypothetical protein